MGIHEEFAEWARKRGLQINNIKAHKFNGKGIGIIAEKNVKAGSTLLHVPQSALKTQNTVSKAVVGALGRISVHGLLATDHALESPHSSWQTWRAVLPSLTEFKESMPLCWPTSFQEKLPPIAKKLLKKQQEKLEIDWTTARKAFPHLVYDKFLHAWLIVNTRTFYFLPKYFRGLKPRRDDCMALNPFSDYMNHSPFPSASVQITDTAFNIFAARNIAAGEEVTISYGNHSNDFLLVEYGFFLEENPWDEVLLDDFIIPRLEDFQKIELERLGFLGDYFLDQITLCYRTKVALGITCMSLECWENFVNGLDEDLDQSNVSKITRNILTECKEDVQEKLRSFSSSRHEVPAQQTILCIRWKQIEKLLQATLLDFI